MITCAYLTCEIRLNNLLMRGGVGHVIVSQYFGVGQQNLCPRKGVVGYEFLDHHFSKYSGRSPPILIDRSLIKDKAQNELPM